MKKALKIILFALFIVCYSLSCFTLSSDKLSGYFSYISTSHLFIKLTVLFATVFIVTLLNKSNADKISKYHMVFINIVLIFLVTDMLFTQISGSMLYFRVWWLTAIFLAEGAVYTASITAGFDRITAFSDKFWKSTLPIYVVVFILLFARTPADNRTTNFALGQGTFKMLEFIVKNSGNADSEIYYITFGNIVFFIPIAFYIKTIFPKIKYHLLIIIGVMLPFIIEGYQYIFKCGNVDVDDILFNITGFLIGLILYVLINSYSRKKELSK